MNIKKMQNFLTVTAFVATSAALLYFSLRLLSGILFPFAAAVVLTVLLQNFIKNSSKKLGIRKKPTAVMIIIVFYLVFGGMIISLGYALYRQLLGIVNMLPEYTRRLTAFFSEYFGKSGTLSNSFGKDGVLDGISDAAVDSFTTRTADVIAGAAAGFAGGIPYFLLSAVVTVIASAFFAKDYDEICSYIKRFVPSATFSKISRAKTVIVRNFTGMIKGYIIIMSVTFAELFFGLLLIRVKYALVIAAVTTVVDILPVLGCGTVLVPWSVFCAFDGNIPRAAGLAVLYVIITIVRNVAEPKIIGSRVGVHPLIMLAAAFLGLKLFGTAGLLLLPVTVILIKSVLESCGTIRSDNGKHMLKRRKKSRICLKSRPKHKHPVTENTNI